MSNLDSDLDQLLPSVLEGRITVEQAQKRCAEHSQELGPLLQAAIELRRAPRPSLDPAARSAIEQRMLARSAQLRVSRPAQAWTARPTARWAVMAVSMLLILAVLTTGSAAASSSLPGQVLYPLKSLGEQVEAWLTPSQDMASLHVRFASHRLDEVMELGHVGIVDDLAIIQMESEMRRAMDLVQFLPAAKQKQVALDILQLTRRQQLVLTTTLDYTPSMSHAGLEWGIDTAQRRVAVLQDLLDK